MSEHIFGSGFGHLSRQTEKLANEQGASVVNYTDASCRCGFGCRPHTCRKSRRHWLTVPEYGQGRAHAKAVLDYLHARGIYP